MGIPVAAGVLLPFTGTILTPSIAGALMGLSSVGVMANSLLLRIRVGSKPNPEQHPLLKFENSTGQELDMPQAPSWRNA